jgi:hypothetical protein
MRFGFQGLQEPLRVKHSNKLFNHREKKIFCVLLPTPKAKGSKGGEDKEWGGDGKLPVSSQLWLMLPDTTL